MKSVVELPSNLLTGFESAAPSARKRSLLVIGLSRLLRLWHLNSLDAPAVALVWACAFAWTAHVHLPLWVPALLVLTVWAVYVADRLLDARSALSTGRLNTLRERHFYHWRHRRMLVPMAGLAAALAAIMVLALMPIAAEKRNSVLAAASLVYFTRVHAPRALRLPLPKELLVGMLFTAGCVLPAWSRATVSATAAYALMVPIAFYASLAWLNCHAIDRWENAAASQSTNSIRRIAVLLSFLALGAAAALAHAELRSAMLLLTGALAALLLALLDARRTRLAPITLRAAADLALLTPLCILALACLFR